MGDALCLTWCRVNIRAPLLLRCQGWGPIVADRHYRALSTGLDPLWADMPTAAQSSGVVVWAQAQ